MVIYICTHDADQPFKGTRLQVQTFHKDMEKEAQRGLNPKPDDKI